jgi:hypothetical protein
MWVARLLRIRNVPTSFSYRMLTSPLFLSFLGKILDNILVGHCRIHLNSWFTIVLPFSATKCAGCAKHRKLIKSRKKATRRNFETARPWRCRPSGKPVILEVPGSNLGPETGRLKDFVQILNAYRKTPGHDLKLGNDSNFSHPFHLSMIFTIPGSKSDLQTALLYQQYLDVTRDPQAPAFKVVCRGSKPAPLSSVRMGPTVVLAVILLCCHWLLSCTGMLISP